MEIEFFSKKKIKKCSYCVKVIHDDVTYFPWVEVISLDCKTDKSAFKLFDALKVNRTYKDKPMALFGHVELDYVLSTNHN